MGLKENIERFERQLRTLDISVLIWGPGTRREDHYKREQIRTVIKEHFPNADVHFSEDEELNRRIPRSEYREHEENELYHLAVFDLCIVLDTSPGTAAEVAHFIKSRHAYKMFILTHQKHENSTGFDQTLRKFGNQVFYSEDEWESCKLTERALARAETIATRKFSAPA